MTSRTIAREVGRDVITWMSRKTGCRCSVAIRPDDPAGGQPVAPINPALGIEVI
jgi:hypothetical protein